MTFRVVPHRIALTTAVIVFALASLLFGTCAAISSGGLAVALLVVTLLALLMAVDVFLQLLRPDVLTLTDEGVVVVEIERTAFVRKSPARWFESRRIEVAWDEVLAIERARFEVDGPTLVLTLSRSAEERVGTGSLRLPSIEEISIEQLTTEMKSRRRAAITST